MFLRRPLTARRALAVFSPREDVDRVWGGAGCVYHARLSAQRTRSRFGQITRSPAYKDMTIRSWQTVRRLEALLDERAADRT